MPKNPLYYNLSIVNAYGSQNTIQPAVIEQLNNTEIITDGTEMFMTVARFSLPSQDIPRLIVPILQGQPNFNETLYNIKFQLQTSAGVYNPAFTVSQNVSFITQYPSSPPVWNPPYIQDTTDSYWWIYDIEQLILMVNNALAQGFSTFCAQAGLPHAYNPAFFPYITFNSSNNIFSIILPANSGGFNYFDQQGGFPNLALQFNPLLLNILGLTTINYVVSPVFYNISCFNKFDNVITSAGTTYYKMTASCSSLNNWSALQKIVIKVNYGISSKSEYDSIPVNPNNTSLTNPNASPLLNTPNIPYLLDFEVDKDSYSINNNFIQYQTSSIAQQRLVGITTDRIKSFQLAVYWVDNFNTTHKFTIEQGLPLTIKLAFYDKNLRLL